MDEGGGVAHENQAYDLDEDDDGEAGGRGFQMRRMIGREEPLHRDGMESFNGTSETDPLLPSGAKELSRRKEIEERVNADVAKTKEIDDHLRSFHPRVVLGAGGLFTGVDEFGVATVKLGAINSVTRPLFGSDGGINPELVKFKKIREALGPTAEEIANENNQRIEGNREEVERIRARSNGRPTEDEQRQVEDLEEETERLEEENEAIEERAPLRERVKTIFKKHGLTAFAVLSAVGTIIGVIVSDLKSGLTKMSKGIGNGLKDIAKKLAGILPGIVGSLVSFLFKTAGEAIGFLSKHAWLLMLLVVTFVVEQFKGR